MLPVVTKCYCLPLSHLRLAALWGKALSIKHWVLCSQLLESMFSTELFKQSMFEKSKLFCCHEEQNLSFKRNKN